MIKVPWSITTGGGFGVAVCTGTCSSFTVGNDFVSRAIDTCRVTGSYPSLSARKEYAPGRNRRSHGARHVSAPTVTTASGGTVVISTETALLPALRMK